MSLEPGQIIDAKYRVVRRIGEGGMGTVYEGENERIGRRVAIKVLHAQVAAMPEFVERFEREARAAARIGSPHVCDVLDLGDLPSGDHYIVMEYLDGVSFEDRIVEREKLPPAQLAPIAFELLSGLGMMHNARVIHRDLKPANVFLAKSAAGRGEVVKILDFGVAKLLPFGGEVGTMTQTGTMMGTPLYMSPEQARGAKDVDGRTDIYAASVMFYRALTGSLPYNAETLNELLFKIVLEDPRPLRELAPEVDEDFAAIVHKGLARDLSQRFDTARAYQEAISAWGRRQGRSSLSFAVTMPSEPPDRLPLPSATGSGRVVAAAITANTGGTPIAWSEDAPARPSEAVTEEEPRADRAEERSGQSKGRPASDPALPSAKGSSPTLSSATSEASPSLDATGPTAPDSVGRAAAANATTGPTAPVGLVPQATIPPARRNLGLIAGVAAAAALAGAIIVVVAGRPAPAAAGLTESTGPSESAAALGSSQIAPGAPAPESFTAATAAELATAEVATADAAPPPKPTTPTTPTSAVAAPVVRAASNPPSGRRPEPTARASAPAATTAAVAPPIPPPKPTSSARKFRTNID
jgi:eukaryotic-like serine/threonine-protein kinase